MLAKRTCVRCGVVFRPQPGSAKLYCSRSCWAIATAAPEYTAVCGTCGVRFFRKKSQIQKPHHGRYCSRTGANTAKRGTGASSDQRFWAHVDLEGPEAPGMGRCWLWIGPRNKNGYGVMALGGEERRRHMIASRFIMRALVGYLHPSDLICHRCDDPPRVNPDHLYIGDYATNGADRSRRLRTEKPR